MFHLPTLTNTPSKWPGRSGLNLMFLDSGIPWWNVVTWREAAPYTSQLYFSPTPRGALQTLERTLNLHMQSPLTLSDHLVFLGPWVYSAAKLALRDGPIEQIWAGPSGHGISGFCVPQENDRLCVAISSFPCGNPSSYGEQCSKR